MQSRFTVLMVKLTSLWNYDSKKDAMKLWLPMVCFHYMNTENNISLKLFAYLAILHDPWKEIHPWIENLPDKNSLSLEAIGADRSTLEMQGLLADQLQDQLNREDTDNQRDRSQLLKIKWEYLSHGRSTGTFITFKIEYMNCEYYLMSVEDDRSQYDLANFTFPHLIGDHSVKAKFGYTKKGSHNG